MASARSAGSVITSAGLGSGGEHQMRCWNYCLRPISRRALPGCRCSAGSSKSAISITAAPGCRPRKRPRSWMSGRTRPCWSRCARPAPQRGSCGPRSKSWLVRPASWSVPALGEVAEDRSSPVGCPGARGARRARAPDAPARLCSPPFLDRRSRVTLKRSCCAVRVESRRVHYRTEAGVARVSSNRHSNRATRRPAGRAR
jgi:hypothetical protein